MFERYTDKARYTIFCIRHGSSQRGTSEISTEHLPLALFREGILADLLPAEIRASIRRETVEAHPLEEKQRSSRPVVPLFCMKSVSLSVLFFMASCSYAGDLGGKVLRSVKQGGISEAQVTLTRETKGKKESIARTTTNKDGIYTFRNVQPGTYVITASGELPPGPACFKIAPLNRSRAEIKDFAISITVDLLTRGLLDLDIRIGCED